LLKAITEQIESIFERDPAARSVIEVLFCYPGLHAILFYRAAHWFWEKRLRLVGRIISHTARFLTGVEIHPRAKIGRRFFIDHGMGVVMGETAEIGDDVLLYHGVTLGGTTWKKIKRHPTIGNNVVVGTGAKILGPIFVGDNTRIGANSVVVDSIPPNSIVAGIPGKVVFRVEGDKKIRMDEAITLDPQTKALTNLLERVRRLEETLNESADAPPQREQKGEESRGRMRAVH
jgi:serine O-acetyltransferase